MALRNQYLATFELRVRELVKSQRMDPNAEDENGEVPIVQAAYLGSEESLRLLLSIGGDPNATDSNGYTCLHWAAEKGRINLLKLLLSLPSTDINVQNKLGCTPLHLACACGYLEVVDTLVQAGADPDIRSVDGWTSLHRAVQDGWEDVVKRLLESGETDLHVQDENGMTCLHLAAENDSRDLVNLLIRHGADPMCRDHLDRTPLDMAYTKLRRKMEGWMVDARTNADSSDHYDGIVSRFGKSPAKRTTVPREPVSEARAERSNGHGSSELRSGKPPMPHKPNPRRVSAPPPSLDLSAVSRSESEIDSDNNEYVMGIGGEPRRRTPRADIRQRMRARRKSGPGRGVVGEGVVIGNFSDVPRPVKDEDVMDRALKDNKQLVDHYEKRISDLESKLADSHAKLAEGLKRGLQAAESDRSSLQTKARSVESQLDQCKILLVEERQRHIATKKNLMETEFLLAEAKVAEADAQGKIMETNLSMRELEQELVAAKMELAMEKGACDEIRLENRKLKRQLGFDLPESAANPSSPAIPEMDGEEFL